MAISDIVLLFLYNFNSKKKNTIKKYRRTQNFLYIYQISVNILYR